MVQAGPRVGREGAGIALSGVELAHRTRTPRGVRRTTERRATEWPGREPKRALAARGRGFACLGGGGRYQPRNAYPQARGPWNADHLSRERADHCDERPLLRLRRAVRLRIETGMDCVRKVRP